MHYDYDVCVIGGGVAGMTAAVRTRWVKAYKAVCCSTLIIEPSILGGLAGWGSTTLTGPGIRFEKGGLAARLARDVRRLKIPVLKGLVRRIEAGPPWTLITESGDRVRCLSVILACGFKRLANEKDYLGRGIFVTYMGYEYLGEILDRAFAAPGQGPVVVVGGERVRNLRRILAPRSSRGAGTITIVDAGDGRAGRRRRRNELRGRVLGYEGGARVEGVRIVADGKARMIPCRAVVLDYNSYELEPCFEVHCDGLRRTREGFIEVDRSMRAGSPGLFAAGDITGTFAAAGKAIGEGIVAGLEAYRHCFRIKFGREAYLFAYGATDFVVPPGVREIPPLRLSMRPRLLTGRAEASRRLQAAGLAPPEARALTARGEKGLMDGRHTFKEILREVDVSREALLSALVHLIEEKAATVHV